ncbi:MAG: hypothetical protein PWP23_2397 [Candidatus Sumerlaeota bacterium]|nr:hypothetical protein [Candidatus Sumerlaeota bacterium]
MSPKRPKTAQAARKSLSPRQRLLLVAFGLGVALGCLLLVEITLRAMGYARPDPFFAEGPDVPGYGTVHVTSENWARRFFFQRVDGKRLPVGSSVPQYYFTPKPREALRVAVIGESTVQGFPYPANLSISQYVQALLQDLAPERDVQVFNFGFTAVASYPVSRVVEETAVQTECDAVVILVGHNEFFGAYGVASSQYAGNSRRLLALHEAYNDLRFVKLLREGIGKLGTESDAGQEAEGGLINYMAADSGIGPDDARRRTAATLLEANVRWSIRHCRDAGIPVLVGTMPSNLSGFAPVGRSVAALPGTDEALKEAMQIEEGPGRLAALEALAEKDANHALLWFRLGEAREKAEDNEGARVAFVRALDLDGMPWRAPTLSNEALRRAAAEEGAALADCVESFQQATKYAAPGWDFFDDHVHPSLRGRMLYARTLVDGLIPLLGLEGREGSLRADEEYQRELGGQHLLSSREAYNRLGSLFEGPPMSVNNEQVYGNFVRIVNDLDARMLPEEANAWQIHGKLVEEGVPGPPPALVAGTLMMQAGKLRPAIYQMGIVRQSRTLFSMPWVQAAWTEGHCRRLLGEPLGPALERDLDRALMVLDVLPQLESGPEAELHKARGQIYWVQERYDDAIAELEKVLAVAESDEARKDARTSIEAIKAEKQARMAQQ